MELIGRTKFILVCWKHFNADLRTCIQVTFFFQQMSVYDAIHRPKVAISSFHRCIWKLPPCIQKPQFFSVPTRAVLYTTILPESSHDNQLKIASGLLCIFQPICLPIMNVD